MLSSFFNYGDKSESLIHSEYSDTSSGVAMSTTGDQGGGGGVTVGAGGGGENTVPVVRVENPNKDKIIKNGTLCVIAGWFGSSTKMDAILYLVS